MPTAIVSAFSLCIFLRGTEVIQNIHRVIVCPLKIYHLTLGYIPHISSSCVHRSRCLYAFTPAQYFMCCIGKDPCLYVKATKKEGEQYLGSDYVTVDHRWTQLRGLSNFYQGYKSVNFKPGLYVLISFLNVSVLPCSLIPMYEVTLYREYKTEENERKAPPV